MSRFGGSISAAAAAAAWLEYLDGAAILPGSNQGIIVRGSARWQSTTAPTNFWGTYGAGANYRALANGLIGWIIPGGGAGTAGGVTCNGLTIPSYQLRGSAPILPASAQRQFRYTYRLVIWREAGNDGKFGVALSDQFGLITGAFEYAGLGLEVNGDGSWRVVRRNAQNGALAINLDTGLSSTTPRLVEFVYTSGPIPQLQLKVDKASQYSVTGDANMIPKNAGAATVSAAYLTVGGDGVSGVKNDYLAGTASLLVEEV